MARSFSDTPGGKSVTAWAITFNGEFAGRIASYYAPRSGGVTTTVAIWKGPIHEAHEYAIHGHAGGYGYDKFSASIGDAFRRAGITLGEMEKLNGDGATIVRQRLEALGYGVMEVC